MICFLPPMPASRPEPEPVPPRTARAAEAVILIFVVLNVLFVLTGLLPLLVKMEGKPVPVACSGPSPDGASGGTCRPPARGGVSTR
jgi:hypothetical protein